MANKKDGGKKKARRKAAALATVATAAAIGPQAAQVAVQKTEVPPKITQAPPTEMPEPPRYEYTKPRPLRTIGDMLKGILGIGSARAATSNLGRTNLLPIQRAGFPPTTDTRLPKIGGAPTNVLPDLEMPKSGSEQPGANPGKRVEGAIPNQFAPDTSTGRTVIEREMPRPGRQQTADGTLQGASGARVGGAIPSIIPPELSIIPASEHPEAVVTAARSALQSMLGLTDEQARDINVVRVEAVQWADASLGLPDPNTVYAQRTTPGYRITLQYGGQFFVYHTDESGSIVKFASQTSSDPGPRIPPKTIPTTNLIPGTTRDTKITLPPGGNARVAPDTALPLPGTSPIAREPGGNFIPPPPPPQTDVAGRAPQSQPPPPLRDIRNIKR